MSRVYFHIDLNAFFASCEVLLDPSLKGKPIAVSGTTRRSVVSTASYEARAFGVHSAQPIEEARRLCRDLIIVQPHYHYYHQMSEDFMNIIAGYTDTMEIASVDECYADMTDAILKLDRPLDLAWQIQKRVRDELGLSCSIGVAPNLFLAKMASDMKKPNGITVLRIREVPQKLWPLPIKDMRGVGARTLPLMEEMNIHTIGDLANWKNPEELRPILGKNTEEMIRRANGYDDRQIVTEWDAKSMGISETFLEDLTDYDELRGMFRSLSRTLSERLRKAGKAGSLVSIRIKYYDFSNADRSVRVKEPVWKADDIYVQAISLFNDNWDQEPVRLIGISVSDFEKEDMLASQINLFDASIARREETISVLNELNKELGGLKLMRASEAFKDEAE
ncbi:MAG: DNA polymerase IV [Solobacterium sp.]|nr:DNA polymerase IV [Solobacterium sp.]